MAARRPKPEDFAIIFEQMVEDTKSLREVCRELGIHHPTVLAEVRINPDVREQYVYAREAMAEDHAERVTEIAAGTLSKEFDADRARVAIDAYKWSAGRMAPKVYGDRLAVAHSYEGLSDLEIDERISALEARAKDQDAEPQGEG